MDKACVSEFRFQFTELKGLNTIIMTEFVYVMAEKIGFFSPKKIGYGRWKYLREAWINLYDCQCRCDV